MASMFVFIRICFYPHLFLCILIHKLNCCDKFNASVQCDLAKGRIADLSPLMAANGFVRFRPPL